MELELYFDFSSPFAYLATTQVERVCRDRGASLTWRPFLLGGLFRAIGTPDVPIAAMPEAKRRHVMVDMQRWAERWGVPLRFPTRFPLRTVTALRLVLLAPEARRGALVHSLMRLCWVEDGDPCDPAALSACLRSADLDPSLLERTEAPEVKAELRRRTDEAVERGVPGAPTFFVGDLMFWGQDRIAFVEAALDGWRPEIG